MGWPNSHLHAFRSGDRRFEILDPESGPSFADVADFDERQFRIRDLLVTPGDCLDYDYDFGDGWEHEIKYEKPLPAAPKGLPSICLAGERACPPEDCGGVPGFYHFLEALSDPKHLEHDDLLAWHGGGFDPESFDASGVDTALRRLKL